RRPRLEQRLAGPVDEAHHVATDRPKLATIRGEHLTSLAVLGVAQLHAVAVGEAPDPFRIGRSANRPGSGPLQGDAVAGGEVEAQRLPQPAFTSGLEIQREAGLALGLEQGSGEAALELGEVARRLVLVGLVTVGPVLAQREEPIE